MSYNYTKELIDKAFTYETYRANINQALAQSPSNEQEKKLRPYFEKNVKVMEQLDARYQVNENLKKAIQKAHPAIWLVLTEGWCGDAAYNVPMMAAVERAFPEKVKLRLLLRDQNLELMDAHLTDGGRSIPKLIVLSEELKELGTWGPRPASLQSLMKSWKSEGLTLNELIPKVDAWYLKDNTNTMQQELTELVESFQR
ncbi:MAG TPA: thioredoxin family protein [Cytophagaceae bacterium]